MGQRLELNLPLQNPSAGGGGLGLGHVARGLQADGQRRVSQRVSGRERGERQGRGDGLLQPAGVAEGANQPVVRFNTCRAGRCGIGGNRGAKSLGSLSRRPGSKKIQTTLAELFGSGSFGCGHGFL